MHFTKAQITDHVHRTLELFFGFAWEANNQVSAQRHAGHGVPNPTHQLPVFSAGVGAAHAAENFIVTSLHR